MKEFLLAHIAVVLIVYGVINLVTFALYGIDKWKAQHNRWRISEACLLLFAFFFGGLGAFLGMQVFRHKTKHLKFQICVPLFLILQLVAIVLVFVL